MLIVAAQYRDGGLRFQLALKNGGQRHFEGFADLEQYCRAEPVFTALISEFAGTSNFAPIADWLKPSVLRGIN